MVGKGGENRVFPKRWEEFLGAVSEAEKRPHLSRSPSSLPTALPTAKQGERRTGRPQDREAEQQHQVPPLLQMRANVSIVAVFPSSVVADF